MKTNVCSTYTIIFWLWVCSACTDASTTFELATDCEGVNLQTDESGWQLVIDSQMQSNTKKWRREIHAATAQSAYETFSISAFNRTKSKLPLPNNTMTALRFLLDEQCPKNEWQVLKDSEDQVVYESIFTECRGHPMRHQIVRIFDAPINRYKLTYEIRVTTLDDDRRSTWIERITSTSAKQRVEICKGPPQR